ncbi:MAG: hypothetical protein P5702_24345 [Limnospira sp. PMC 1291.21]|nr:MULTISPECIES: hypothetical protein [unclassified Limnospira]MDT9180687.1 hypothetical protein [Limnospira sp. PMC 1238.20]MDT9303294.1 hypothetical protein [Limnospira sp. PMC 1281.21]QJB28835.1 hypothetical protein HFV01_27330 [Limnospira fusiformis SAG 85.79]MDT9196043.1 hypothetical protein [Limnospira sp. PMC 1245.20]MDT9206268.1 hypothetical protein [Limnospira sp. PMC 1243.20]
MRWVLRTGCAIAPILSTPSPHGPIGIADDTCCCDRIPAPGHDAEGV